MHRASAACPALLMATATAALLVARVHSSALETVNPWLSACDIVHPAANDDLQGACSTIGLTTSTSTATQTMLMMAMAGGPGPPTCPPPCTTNSFTTSTSAAAAAKSRTTQTTSSAANKSINSSPINNSSSGSANNNNFLNQCLLYLEESHKDAVCDGGNRDQRLRQIHELRLRHCCEHAVVTALKPLDRQAVLAGGALCKHHLNALLEIDALAARISCEFTEVLTRYDCGQPYSIVYHCDDCKEAYRRWVCSSLVPHLTETGGRVRPCRNVCQTVEQRCPYMLPGDRAPAHPTQYAGEPTFLCLDPNIPETGRQRLRSSHGDDDCCYTYCGTPGRPCSNCPSGALNITWDFVKCPPPTGLSRGTSECRTVATAGSVASSAPNHHHRHQQQKTWMLMTLSATVVLCRWTTTITTTTPPTWTILMIAHVVLLLSASRTNYLNINNYYYYYADILLHCLLLMSVQCARTPHIVALRIKTKWKSRRRSFSSSSTTS